jgi:hypothetical protein
VKFTQAGREELKVIEAQHPSENTCSYNVEIFHQQDEGLLL